MQNWETNKRLLHHLFPSTWQTETVEEPIEDDAEAAEEPEKEASEDDVEVEEEEEDKDKPKTKKVGTSFCLTISEQWSLVDW